jgi:hypothetical protein
MAYAVPVDLFVGNFFDNDADVLKFNGTTGAFEKAFVPFRIDSFPLGAAFGSNGNLCVSDSNTDSVLRVNGITGTLIDTFASNVDDAARMKFGPDGNLHVVDSFDPGAVTKLNGITGAAMSQLTADLVDPEGIRDRTAISTSRMAMTPSDLMEPVALLWVFSLPPATVACSEVAV